MLASGQMFGSYDPVDLFSQFLETFSQRSSNQDDKNELVADLFEVLSELKIDSPCCPLFLAGAFAFAGVSSLLEVADQAGQNPFDLYEYMNSFLACFPTEASEMLLTELSAIGLCRHPAAQTCPVIELQGRRVA